MAFRNRHFPDATATRPNVKRPPLLRGLATLFALAALSQSPTHAATTIELDPVGNGPYPIACSNLEQDFGRSSAPARTFWEGTRSDTSRYVSQLLVAPQHALRYTVTPPDNRTLFRNFRKREVEFVALVCYPTTEDNPRPPFLLPDGGFLPAMQRGDEAPLLPERCEDDACDEPARWPLLLYSHGMGGSPLSESYLLTMARFASHGYIVAAPFHADARFSRIKLEDLGDAAYLLTRHEELVEMQAMRPLALQGLLDHLLARPDFAPHIDAERIAGFGASLGGEAMLLLAGAELTTSLGQSRRQVLQDSRLKAIVTFVPYSGVSRLPAFGDDQRGTAKLDVPYLGVSGSEDRIAPVSVTREAVRRMRGTRYLISVKGMGHGANLPIMDEAYAWYLTFLDANLNGDRAALSRLYRASNVRGGDEDKLEFAVQAGVAPLAGETAVREFYHADLNHFFITGSDIEAGFLNDNPDWGWVQTGHGFAAAPVGSPNPAELPVCRFYGDQWIGPNSHFHTASKAECDFLVALRAQTPAGVPAWNLEGIAFSASMPDAAGNCPDDAPFPVWRAYNGHRGEVVNGVREDANHRYATDSGIFAEGGSAGWSVEGVAFCSAAPLRETVAATAEEPAAD